LHQQFHQFVPLDFNRRTAAACVKTAVIGNRGGRRGDGDFNNILACFLLQRYVRRDAQDVFCFVGDIVSGGNGDSGGVEKPPFYISIVMQYKTKRYTVFLPKHQKTA
jgi:hypothetical protein